MAELPLRSLQVLDDAGLAAALGDLAEAIDWPVPAPVRVGGPDLAAGARARIEAGDVPSDRGARWRSAWDSWRPVRRVLVVAVVALLALALLAVVAGAAGLGLPGVRIFLGSVPVAPPPTPAPLSTHGPSTPPGSTMHLGQRVELADLDARAGFPVRWPQDPGLGPPDAAYIDPTLGNQVTLVSSSRADLPDTIEPGVGLVMSVFRGSVDNAFLEKAVGSGTTVQLVSVDGDRAFWLSGGPHFFFYSAPGGQVFDPRRWVGDALLWADGSTTSRLESALGRERDDPARRIATLTERRGLSSSHPVLRNPDHAAH
jgi:hypothetical protein